MLRSLVRPCNRRSTRRLVRSIARVLCLSVSVIFATTDRWACAQNVVIGAPVAYGSETYYEFIQTQWGISYQGPRGQFFFARGPGAAVGPWGGPPTVQIGWAGQAGPFRYGLNLLAGQGVRRSYAVTVPYLTVMNGYPGYLAGVQYRPYVLQTVPFVFPQRMAPPWQQALAPSHFQGQPLQAVTDVRTPPVERDDRPVRIVPRKAGGDDPPLQLGVKSR